MQAVPRRGVQDMGSMLAAVVAAGDLSGGDIDAGGLSGCPGYDGVRGPGIFFDPDSQGRRHHVY